MKPVLELGKSSDERTTWRQITRNNSPSLEVVTAVELGKHDEVYAEQAGFVDHSALNNHSQAASIVGLLRCLVLR